VKSRPRTIAALFVPLLPLALWLLYFNALYAGQTLACLSFEPLNNILIIGALVGAALMMPVLMAIVGRGKASDLLRRAGIVEIGFLSAIATILLALAVLAIPPC
jgi:hypothetical protein